MAPYGCETHESRWKRSCTACKGDTVEEINDGFPTVSVSTIKEIQYFDNKAEADEYLQQVAEEGENCGSGQKVNLGTKSGVRNFFAAKQNLYALISWKSAER